MKISPEMAQKMGTQLKEMKPETMEALVTWAGRLQAVFLYLLVRVVCSSCADPHRKGHLEANVWHMDSGRHQHNVPSHSSWALPRLHLSPGITLFQTISTFPCMHLSRLGRNTCDLLCLRTCLMLPCLKSMRHSFPASPLKVPLTV